MQVDESTSKFTKSSAFVHVICYETFAGVVSQFESHDSQSSVKDFTESTTNNSFRRGRQTRNQRGANLGTLPGNKKRVSRGKRPPEDIALRKAEDSCHVCNRFFHWNNAQNDDGSLKPGTPCHESSDFAKAALRCTRSNATVNVETNSDSNKKPVIKFTTSLKESDLSSSSHLKTDHNTLICAQSRFIQNTPVDIGPLVDEGAPYRAIGNVELRYL